VFFSPLLTHLTRPEGLFISVQAKKGSCRKNNNSFGVQEGAVMTSREYLQRRVRQGLHVVHKAQQKVCLNQLGLSEEQI
jgi:hypothetical protein